MSDAVVLPKRASLWREGLRTFRVNWREWSKTAVWFFVITTLAYVMMMKGVSDVMPDLEIKAGQKLSPAQQSAMLSEMVGSMFIWMIPVLLIVIVKTYVFVVFFTRKQHVFGAPEASIGGFFRWFGYYILLMLALMGVGVVSIGAPAALAALGKGVIPGFVSVILSLTGMVFIYFVALRLYPVMILSTCHIKPLFKTSWKITKGTCWRLIGHAIILMLICFLVYIVLAIIFAIGGTIIGFATTLLVKTDATQAATHVSDGKFGFISIMIFAPIAGLLMTVFGGVIWAFYCTAVRIFYEEKYAADPSFVLTRAP